MTASPVSPALTLLCQKLATPAGKDLYRSVYVDSTNDWYSEYRQQGEDHGTAVLYSMDNAKTEALQAVLRSAADESVPGFDALDSSLADHAESLDGRRFLISSNPEKIASNLAPVLS